MEKILLPGHSINKTPINPISIAANLRHPITSFKIGIDNRVAING